MVRLSTRVMLTILSVAEKNDAAKGIATLLSRGSRMNRREGRSKFNKIYSFTCMYNGRQAVMNMTSVSGHLLNYEFGIECKNWRQTPYSVLFKAPIRKTVMMRDIQETLVREAQRADVLIIWTDCDREGENIGDEIRQVCVAVKRNLIVQRARFSEITAQAVQRAMDNLQMLDEKQAQAVDARQELDLRIGAAFTRLQTIYLNQRFAGKLRQENAEKDALISYGSCQFPTLGFVVQRYYEINAFVPEQFWRLRLTHKVEDVTTEFNWERRRLFNRDTAEMYLDECRDDGMARVLDVKSAPRSRYRPMPMDTIELEKLATKKLRMTAKTAMAVAERLYTKGFISYPRTETTKFAPEINLRQLIEAQAADTRWDGFVQQVLQRGVNARNGNKSDGAHPPIHPLKPLDTNASADEKRVYELVTRHFIACCSWDARGEETTVNVECGGENFTGTGLRILDRGFLQVYPYQKWEGKMIGSYTTGQQFKPDSIEMLNGHTTAPQLLTEADLITLMDKNGIGTDATHAEHIEKIKERRYVAETRDKRLIPTLLGLALVDGYSKIEEQMTKPHLRAGLELDLKRIENGTDTRTAVLARQLEQYKRIFEMTELQVMLLGASLREKIKDGANPMSAAPLVAHTIDRSHV